MPMTTDKMVQKNPTTIAIIIDCRVPAMSWLKTSWPKDVVPRGWAHDRPMPGL